MALNVEEGQRQELTAAVKLVVLVIVFISSGLLIG